MQRVKQKDQYSDWGLVLGGIPKGSALGPLLFLVYVNEMPLKVQYGCLLQFADDTCLICAGDTSDIVAKALQNDLITLSGWVTESKMQFNLVLCGLVSRDLLFLCPRLQLMIYLYLLCRSRNIWG